MNKQAKVVRVIALILAGIMLIGAATIAITFLLSGGHGHVH